MKIMADVNIHTDRVEINLLYKLVEQMSGTLLKVQGEVLTTLVEVVKVKYEMKVIQCDIKNAKNTVLQTKEILMSEISDFSDAAMTNLTALQTSLTNIAKDIQDIKDAATGITQVDKDKLAAVAVKLTTLAAAAADLDGQNPATPVISPVEPTPTDTPVV